MVKLARGFVLRHLASARISQYQRISLAGVEKGESDVKKFAIGAILVGALMPAPTRAQIKIDMTRITCAQYLAMPPEDSKVFSAWMSGWFNQKTGYTTVDLAAYERNVANVKQWC